MLSGPELARITQPFEEQFLTDQDPDNPKNFHNHESGQAAQQTFCHQVNNLCDVIRQTENPFLDDFLELVNLDNRDSADFSMVESVHKIDEIDKVKYQCYVKNVTNDCSSSIHNPIKKNNLPFFWKNQKETSKKITVLQSNLNLFSQLYIGLLV